MKYIAIHYVKIAGRMFTPGEIFEADIAPEKEERLLIHGAIRFDEAQRETPKSVLPAPLKATEEPQESEADEGNDADANEEPKNSEDIELEEDEDLEEADEDAPEIDVMEGLVPETVKPAEEEAPKPAPKPKAVVRKRGGTA